MTSASNVFKYRQQEMVQPRNTCLACMHKLNSQENSDVLGNVGRELRMLRGELARRVLPPLPRAFAAAA